MTSLDWAVVVFIGLSVLLAFWRGAVRAIVALTSWVVGIVAGFAFSGAVAGMFPDWQWGTPVKQATAFLIILATALIVGSISGRLLSKFFRAVGLGFLDRLLGAVFGLIRGVLFVLVVVLIVGLTPLPKLDWWQKAEFREPLEAGALYLRQYLPEAWAARIDYSRSKRSELFDAGWHVAVRGLLRGFS